MGGEAMGNISYRKIKSKKAKNGYTWQYRFDITPQKGKRIRVTKGGFSTKKECIRDATKAREEYDRTGYVLKNKRMSFSDLLDEWLEKESVRNVQTTTLEGYEKKIHTLIKPHLGHYDIKSISKQTIKDFIHKIYQMDYSRNTLQNTKGILVKCFDYAIDKQYLLVNPAQNVKLPNEFVVKKEKHDNSSGPTRGDKQRECIKPEDYLKILERFPEGTIGYIPLVLGYRCGLRLGEAFALTWSDIDLENKRLEINRQIQWKTPPKKDRITNRKNVKRKQTTGYWYFKSPKYSSFRTIDLDDKTAELLKKEKQIQEQDKKEFSNLYSRYYCEQKLVYGGQIPENIVYDNRIYEYQYDEAHPQDPYKEKGLIEVDFILRYTSKTFQLVYDRWNDCLKQTRATIKAGVYIDPRKMQNVSCVIHHKLNMKKFDYHSLRHTHATMLREHGLPDVYIQKRLGHKKIDTTINVYANHLSDTIIQQGIEQLNHLYDK